MKRLIVQVAMLSTALSVVAQDHTWKGGAGNLTDNHWWNEPPPASDGSGHVMKFLAGESVLNIDRDAEVATLTINSGAHVTFTGTNRLVVIGGSATTLSLGDALTIDGPNVVFGDQFYNYGSFEVKSGSFVSEGVLWAMDAAAVFALSGGRMEAASFCLDNASGASFAQSGGYAKFAAFTSSAANNVSVKGGVFDCRTMNLAVPVGVADYGSATNIVAGVTFSSSASTSSPADYYGPALILGGSGIVKSSYAGFPHGISLGGFANWSCNSKNAYVVREHVAFDTADFFSPETKRTIAIRNFGINERAGFSAFGGGTVDFPSENSSFPSFLSSFAVGDGTSLVLEPYVYNGVLYNKNSRIAAGDISFGAGSHTTLMADFDRFSALNAMTFGGGAKFTVTATKTLTAATRYVLFDVGPRGAIPGDLDITLDDTTYASYIGADAFAGWMVRKVANVAWLDDGNINMSPTASDTSEWCGGSGRMLSTDANWSCGARLSDMTSGSKDITVKTLAGEIENDVDGLNFRVLKLAASCGPLVMSGRPILFSHAGSASSGSSIFDDGIFPIVFNNEVRARSGVTKVGITLKKGYVAFMGGLDMANVQFGISGRTHVGCTATVKDLFMNTPYYAGAGDLSTELVILDGGTMTVSAQVTPFFNAGNSAIRVLDGGVLSFAGGTFSNRVAVAHTVFGRFDIGVPLSTTSTIGFFGSGRVHVASTKSSGTASSVEIGERLRLYPGAWATVTEDGEGPVTIKVVTHATIGATNDWTYGVADGVATATTSASRALVVANHETLTLDTQSPDDASAHTITLADPVFAPGAFLVKEGAGSLVLASADNDLATTGVFVSQGELVCCAPQSFGAFSAAAGTRITAGAVAGSVAEITVDGDIALDGVVVDLSKAARSAALNWTPVLTVPSGKKIVGTPVAGRDMKAKVVTNVDGSMSLCCRARAGTLLIVF
ncbi:MAG: hypothetical protein IJG84_09950 [Kiritimatiellae bacterium]|nr:hypothetical protein [Kiritimatiellia bacterium]